MAMAAAPSASWCRTSKRITSSLPPLPIFLSPSTTLFFRQALPGSSATTATASPPSPLAPTPLALLLDPSITPSSSTNFPDPREKAKSETRDWLNNVVPKFLSKSSPHKGASLL
ncbi:uncharacterized protein LOC115954090 isoform X1 [Quercus lobata]|uniref:uncharacterized protein LOC115954090 isoform X1 n=1 Tax=Quercus lobata TaxID=97700 RepID=UPI0012475238|nr:uncharacterized protein LOC115954090 isoform X1 [Quercus lobata]